MSSSREARTVLMATDVPFWNASTGAQQRMLSMAKYLSGSPFRLVTFYVGEVGPDDPARIAMSGLEVVFYESARPPAAFVARLKWYAEATRMQLQRLVGPAGNSQPAAATVSDSPEPLQVADYSWPWAIEQFRETVRNLNPVAIICQYVTMSYLIGALSIPERKKIRCILDTHDILHDRGIQFGSAGYMHWLEISREEEAGLWDRFDAVLAIQSEEAGLIHELAPKPKVLVTPHSIDYLTDTQTTVRQGEMPDELVIGYIGSANYSNWHAINRFLIESWPELLEQEQPRIRLLIAGKICDWFQMRRGRSGGSGPGTGTAPAELMQRVELAGEMPQLKDFYQRIDIAVNPVQFGTGLKIKNVEALAYGVPLVTTLQGVAGMSEEARSGCVVAQELMDMPRHLVRLASDPQLRRQLARRGREVAKSEFSDENAFSQLREYLAPLA